MKKTLLISLLLSILLIATPFSELNLNILAAQPTRTQQEAKNWIINAEGKFWNWDKQDGAQCVDLIYYYYDFLGVTPRGGDANTYIFDDSKVPYELGWKKIQCYDGFRAQTGDIALFDYGTAGHVGLIIEGDVYGFTTLENNRNDYSGTSNAQKGVRGYGDLKFWGVIRPKFKPSCSSHSFNASSICTKCQYSYDYKSTKVKFQGTAKATEKVYVRKSPYEVGELVDTYSSGTNFSVTGKVVNGYGNEWYIVLNDEGNVCVERYIVASKLKLTSHTCAKGEFEYYWTDHPHYNSYKCKVCGKSIVDYNSSNFSANCTKCSTSGISTGTYAIKNNSNGKYLCVSYGADVNKQNVDLYTEINAASKMIISAASTGYKMRPECCASRLINPFGDVVTSGLNVNIYNDMNDSSQWWQFQKVSGGYIIRNVQNSNCVLDTDGGNVFVSTYTGATTQVWSLVSFNTHTHSYSSWKVRKAATCTTAGIEYRVCSCGNETTRTISALGHKYDNDCDKFCNRCNELRATDHRWVPSDCTSPTTCYICYINKGDAKGHTYKTTSITKATTSKNGKVVKTCTVCDKKTTTTIKYPKTFKLSATSYTYNGKVKTPSVTVKDSAGKTLKKDTDYTVTYSKGRKNIGAYKVIVKMKGKYSGTKTLTFKINPKIKLSTTSYTYNGKTKKPSVTVTNSLGKKLSTKYYTVSYSSGRKKVGTYTATVKFKNGHSGTYKYTFKINPAKTTVSKLTAGKKSIKVAIAKKTTQVTGYQIQYSTSKKFTNAKTKTISSYKTTKYTLKNLGAKKTYYVRVRTYKTVGKTKYYSGWSTYKYKKTK